MKNIILPIAFVLATSGLCFADDFDDFDDSTEYGQKAGASDGVNIAIGAKISTLGIGPELALGFNDYLTVRVSGGWGEFSVDGDTDDIDWDATMNLANGLATVEWNIFGGGFHIDAGLLVHDNYIGVKTEAEPGTTVDYNGTTYRAEEAGRVQGNFEFESSVAPYLGIGWGNLVDDYTDWTFFLNLGVVFNGSPTVSLSSDGTLANNPIFLADLRREEQKLEDELEKYKYYPVIAVGLAYKF